MYIYNIYIQISYIKIITYIFSKYSQNYIDYNIYI